VNALIVAKEGNVLMPVVNMAKIATEVASLLILIVPHSRIQNPRK
jgi:hypothetical protein